MAARLAIIIIIVRKRSSLRVNHHEMASPFPSREIHVALAHALETATRDEPPNTRRHAQAIARANVKVVAAAAHAPAAAGEHALIRVATRVVRLLELDRVGIRAGLVHRDCLAAAHFVDDGRARGRAVDHLVLLLRYAREARLLRHAREARLLRTRRPTIRWIGLHQCLRRFCDQWAACEAVKREAPPLSGFLECVRRLQNDDKTTGPLVYKWFGWCESRFRRSCGPS